MATATNISGASPAWHSSLASFFPGYFALVMATGIVSVRERSWPLFGTLGFLLKVEDTAVIFFHIHHSPIPHSRLQERSI
jgi:hypothetical protein